MAFGCKKQCSAHGSGHEVSISANHERLIWVAWMLQSVGFNILLGGVASMQRDCGRSTEGSGAQELTQVGRGTVGYLAPVSCSHFFQYTWSITFLHFFTWSLVLIYRTKNVIHKTRAALVGILAVAAVLLMDTANTYLMQTYIPGLSGSILASMRVTIAGAVISAVANLLLILIIGWSSEPGPTVRADTHPEHKPYTAAGASNGVAVPATTQTHVPASTAV